MAVVRIDALCACEWCGKRFGVEIDTAFDLTDVKTLEDLVEKTIDRTEVGFIQVVRGKQTIDRDQLGYFVTVQGGMILCDNCSFKIDEQVDDDVPTAERIKEILKLKELEESFDEPHEPNESGFSIHPVRRS